VPLLHCALEAAFVCFSIVTHIADTSAARSICRACCRSTSAPTACKARRCSQCCESECIDSFTDRAQTLQCHQSNCCFGHLHRAELPLCTAQHHRFSQGASHLAAKTLWSLFTRCCIMVSAFNNNNLVIQPLFHRACLTYPSNLFTNTNTGCRPIQYQQELGARAGKARWHWARRLQQTVSVI
jgi:hypothetical protein